VALSQPQSESSLSQPSHLERLREVFALFLKLGCISYGGPAAHIALMENEVVRKRQWLTRQQFLDLLGAANLIPGPSSTEMAINIGFVRAGWGGLCLAGASFILPAAVITGAFAWAYTRFGALTQAASVLGGIKAAVISVIALAIWRLGKAAVHNWLLTTLAAIALMMFLFGVGPLPILFGGGFLGMLAIRYRQMRAGRDQVKGEPNKPDLPAVLISKGALLKYATWTRLSLAATAISAPVLIRPSLREIAKFFLKVGAVLYGGGYVLLAFLEQGLVHQHAWLTQKQLLDAVAIGQFTPGPVLSTATFIGYILGGLPGAAVATVAIFLPSFFYVALLAPVLFKLRQSPWMAAFLDSVNVCAVALMAGVTVKLGADALRGWPSVAIAVAALAVLWRWKVNPAWVVLGGGLLGMATRFLP
jgi:chromate transporter